MKAISKNMINAQLAIVDHTRRGHGGFVRVESEPERGSTFSLYFPIPSENAFQGTLATGITETRAQ